MQRMSVTGMLKTMIPISRFNKGEANKNFNEVEMTGAKIVVKTTGLPVHCFHQHSMSH